MANIVFISGFSDPRLDVYSRLTENQLVNRADPENSMFIAESPNVILRALDAGYEPVSILTEPDHIDGSAACVIARCGDIPVFTADGTVLGNITGFRLTRGVLCAMKRRALPAVNEILDKSDRVVIIDEVMNPTNVGAIFRSAAALGMDAVLLTKGSSDPLYRRSARVSMGTVFQIPWTYLPANVNSGSYAAFLRKYGFKTAALALSSDCIDIDSDVLKKEPKLAVSLGTEGTGLADEAILSADYVVKIPMYHGVDSLNVAAASAVAFWELSKK